MARDVGKLRARRLRGLGDGQQRLAGSRVVVLIRLIDVDDDPFGLEPLREAPGLAHKLLLRPVRADADHQQLLRRPDRLDRVRDAVGPDVGVDPVGDAAERKLA